ncbi:MAG TPA: hypothetical protein VM573_06375 [Actinomycetota bacterium]|nr:hypothetical protein [Actinomycetota bacterium]
MARSKVIRALAVAVCGAVLTAGPLSAAVSPARRARVAVRYIVSKQKNNGSIPAFSPVGSTADAVIAMVAARRAPKQIAKAIDYLRAQARGDGVTGIGLTSKVVLAVVAAGGNPRRFGGRNLVREIRSTLTDSGRFGDGTAVFDHALAMLAVAAAAGAPGEAPARWLAAAQCGDGGWQYDEPAGASDDDHCVSGEGDFFASDTNTTALAVQALEAANEEAPRDPFAFFAAIRDATYKGWGYSWGFEITDANSTAMVIQAHAAADRELPAGAARALRRLQYRLCGKNGGAFAFTWADMDGDGDLEKSGPDVGATVAAVPGLLRRPLPLRPATVELPAPRRVAC